MDIRQRATKITAEWCRENNIGHAAGNAIAFLVGYEKTGNRDDLSQAQKWLDFLRGAEEVEEPVTEESSATEEPPELIVIVEDWVGPCGLNLEKGDMGYWQLEPNWHGYYFAGGRLQWETIQANRTKWRALK